jgi:hypothetical protein
MKLMADERAGLWFVTEVETSEQVEVVEGGAQLRGCRWRLRIQRRPGGS